MRLLTESVAKATLSGKYEKQMKIKLKRKVEEWWEYIIIFAKFQVQKTEGSSDQCKVFIYADDAVVYTSLYCSPELTVQISLTSDLLM